MNTYTTQRWLAISAAVLVAVLLAGALLTGTVQAQGAIPQGNWAGHGMMGGHRMGSPMMGGHGMMGSMMGSGLGATTPTTDTTSYGYPHHGWGMMGGYGLGTTTPMTGTTSTYGCPWHAGMGMGWHN